MRTDIIGFERSEAHAVLRILQKMDKKQKDPMMKHMQKNLEKHFKAEGKVEYE